MKIDENAPLSVDIFTVALSPATTGNVASETSTSCFLVPYEPKLSLPLLYFAELAVPPPPLLVIVPTAVWTTWR